MAQPDWHLKEWREHRGLSQAKLAEKVTDLTETWRKPVRLKGGDVSNLENGKRRWNRDQLKAFAEVLGCDEPADLFYTPKQATEIKKLVRAIVRRGRPKDLRLLRELAAEDEAA